MPVKKYIAVDVEASGPVPGKFSMLSFGACAVGGGGECFYAELRPISENYDIAAMRVGSAGLKCIRRVKKMPEYDVKSEKFSPDYVLDVLSVAGKKPKTAMKEFADWVSGVSKKKTAVLVSNEPAFDGMFIHWYFGTFYGGPDPFGHGGEHMGSLYRGLVKDLDAGAMKKLGEGRHTHNALDDAKEQAKAFSKLLKMF